MKRTAILLAILGSFLFAQIDFASNNVQEELTRVEKIAKEKINEAKNLEIGKKALQIILTFNNSEVKNVLADKLEIRYSRRSLLMEIEVWHNKQIVFHAFSPASPSEEVKIFRSYPAWLIILDDFYQQALKKEMLGKIEDLKSRYDIK